MKRSTAALLLLLVALPLAAQEEASVAVETPGAEEEQEGIFFETVDVNVVNIEVFVTDKKGDPVGGLTRDDFEVFENGRPVAITNFYAVEGGKPVAGLPAATQTVESEVPGMPALPYIPEEQRLHLIIYVDNFNIRPFNRNRVFRRVREFLHTHVDAQDRVMLVSYDRSLHYRHPFTSDSGLVANALFGLEKLSGHAVHKDSEWREILRDIHDAGSLGEVSWRVRQYAESRHNDLLFTIDALTELVGTLGGLEGRKALLYVSDGLEMSAGEELFHALLMKFGDTTVMSQARDFHLGRRFQKLTAHANANRVTFYTIDAAGLRVSIGSSVEMSSAGSSPGLSTFIDQVYISNLQSPLRMLAEDTGGLAIFNTNDVGPGLDRVARDFDSYYSLGYTPAHAGDGRFYRVDVKVKEKGMEVRHREGYRDKSLYSRMSESTTASLMYGYYSNPLDVEIKVGPGSPAEKSNQFDVPVAVEIPLSKIVLVPQERFHEGRVKLFFSAIDEDGDMSEVSEVPLQIRIANEQVEEARSQPYTYAATLRMRRGGHRIAVGVRDEIGATDSFVIRTLQVGS